MKNRYLYLSFFCFFTAIVASAQSFYQSFNSVARPCLFNASQIVFAPSGVLYYQTLDGTQDGQIDSSRCISSIDSTYGTKIYLYQLDISKPLFVKLTVDSTLSEFTQNQVLDFAASVGLSPGVALSYGSDCVEDLCTGAFIDFYIPDENGVANAAIRMNTALATKSNNAAFVYLSACIPTEKFTKQPLKNVLLKFSFDMDSVRPSDFIHLKSVSLYNASPFTDEFPVLLEQIEAHGFHLVSADSFSVQLRETINDPFGFFGGAVLAKYQDVNTYPSSQNLTYIEAKPVPNTATAKKINLTIDDFETLVLQPFTNLRGGLTTDDSTRHQLTVDNHGGTICFGFIDLVFNGGDRYVHHGGSIEINNAYACMQFRNGSTIGVGKDAALHYGNQGAGMLVLGEGSSVEIEDGGALILDAFVSLTQHDYSKAPESIWMDLKPNTRLEFTENAYLTNEYSVDKAMQLNIRMLGGTLDDSALSPEERAIINRIYPEPTPVFAENWALLGNPSSYYFDIQYLSAQTETCQVDLLDLQGRSVLSRFLRAEKGGNTFHFDHNLAAGMYVLRFRAGVGESSRVLLVVD